MSYHDGRPEALELRNISLHFDLEGGKLGADENPLTARRGAISSLPPILFLWGEGIIHATEVRRAVALANSNLSFVINVEWV